MRRCLSVVWQVGACFRLPDSRDLPTPEPPLGDHILGSPHPWATPGRPHPRGSPTPGPPLGDQFLGTPLPLGHPWVAKSLGIPYSWATPGRQNPRGPPPLGHHWATKS